MHQQSEITDPHICSINISEGGIPKYPVKSVRVTHSGMNGDGHNHEKHNNPIQAVCLQDAEILEELNREGFSLSYGSTGENLTTRQLNVNTLSLGTILQFSGGVVLEISKVRKPCYVLDEIDPILKDKIIGRCGMYAKVLTDGEIKTEETLTVNRPN